MSEAEYSLMLLCLVWFISMVMIYKALQAIVKAADRWIEKKRLK